MAFLCRGRVNQVGAVSALIGRVRRSAAGRHPARAGRGGFWRRTSWGANLKRHLFAGALALGLSVGATAHAAIDITVTPWLAPNFFGSPSFAPAAANAVNALMNGQTTGGVAGTPSYFQAQSNITAQEAIVTGFPSWLGQADPGTVFEMIPE